MDVNAVTTEGRLFAIKVLLGLMKFSHCSNTYPFAWRLWEATLHSSHAPHATDEQWVAWGAYDECRVAEVVRSTKHVVKFQIHLQRSRECTGGMYTSYNGAEKYESLGKRDMGHLTIQRREWPSSEIGIFSRTCTGIRFRRFTTWGRIWRITEGWMSSLSQDLNQSQSVSLFKLLNSTQMNLLLFCKLEPFIIFFN